MYKQPRECWKLIDFEAVRLGVWYTLFRWNETETCSRLDPLATFIRTQNACEGICITCTFFCLSLVWHWACRRCRHAHLKSVGELQRKPGQVQKESKLHSFMQFNVFFPLLLLFPCCSRSDQSLGQTTAKTFAFKAVCHFCHTRQTSTEQKRAMQSMQTKYNIQHYKFCAYSECTTESECRKTQSYIIKCYFEFSEMHSISSHSVVNKTRKPHRTTHQRVLLSSAQQVSCFVCGALWPVRATAWTWYDDGFSSFVLRIFTFLVLSVFFSLLVIDVVPTWNVYKKNEKWNCVLCVLDGLWDVRVVVETLFVFGKQVQRESKSNLGSFSSIHVNVVSRNEGDFWLATWKIVINICHRELK